jgi:nicotinate-nucleotide adenylyltransferase
MGRVIGVFGGTFDPPHLGHLILAEAALDELGLEAILWVLTPRSPLKPEGEPAPVELRLRLIRTAIEANARFRVSTADVDRSPPYYTVDTMERLQAAEPGADLVLLMGSDALEELPCWHEPQRLVERCAALGVMDRPAHPVDLASLEGPIPGIGKKVRLFRAPKVEISGREIRRRVAEGRSIRYLVPDAVGRTIEQEGVYRRRA